MTTDEIYSLMIEKAKKWDALNERISEFYDEDSGMEEGMLCEIGEIAAIAFGYL